MIKLLRGLTLLLLVWIGTAQAQSLVIGQTPAASYDINSHTLFKQLDTDADFQQVANGQQWQRLRKDSLPWLGAQHLWLKFSITNLSQQSSWVLVLDNPHIDSMELFLVQAGEVINHWHMGDHFAFAQRPIDTSDFLLPLSLAPYGHYDFYLKINTNSISNLPIHLLSGNEFAELSQTRNLFSGFQIGLLCAIGLFSLFTALAMRSLSYGYYAGYVFSMAFIILTLRGHGYHYFWPNSPSIQHYILQLLIPLALIFALMFTEKMLNLKQQDIRLLRLSRISVGYCVLLMLFALIGQNFLVLKIQLISAIVCSGLMIFIAWVLSRKGYTLAKLSLCGWLLILLGILATCLCYLEILQCADSPNEPLLAALSLEIILMAGVLAYRFHLQFRATQKAQTQAQVQAEHLREVRLETMRAESARAEQLELMVQQRTLELEIALKELGLANEKLTIQTKTDSLTGVRNRKAFDQRLTAEGRVSRRQHTPLALLMVDIDKFKEINDTFGHLAGDDMLRAIAITLTEQLKRPTDLLSRFGGEEFAIILPNTDTFGAQHVAERIRLAVDNLQIDRQGIIIPLTVSIGVSAAVIVSENQVAELLELADKALYQAKNQGRNRVCLAP
ncbi:diguanylate cyclase [Shewanella sp. NIFS-20-20]|uniref:sensor domain-containing diguanylate cyclase n=1 Tax=Shewanella sp. NIFS-20-20 TaxID=2853806 RepID=UPI001C471960|nr:diguanylate cyclase [Shewanella sp. NIFS-20-20]MBV7316847.1 sensor domain-containing diguanylate cyclase [Shewanella sp. NIFS-20-20]